jgi:arabinose-5-phosphate isomerase
MSKRIDSFHFTANILHELAFDEDMQSQIEFASYMIVRAVSQKARGRIITTGMGKAGHIARKFASTLSSIAIPAHYVHPGEAAHGDLGQIEPSDLVFAMSTSGRTVEIEAFLKQLEALQACPVVGITSHPEFMADLVNHIVAMPVMVEADRYNLVPTVSTTVLLAICDAISIRAMEDLGITRQNFAARHHGGYLGQLSREDIVKDVAASMGRSEPVNRKG